jgi:transcriptional regulator with XRE-family HTH domain
MTEQKCPDEFIDQYIGRRLKQRRVEIGHSQEKLAILVGLTFQQIQKYEKGINRISASRLFDLARILEVPIAFFYEGLETLDEACSSPIFNDIMINNLVEAFRKIQSHDVKKSILTLIENLTHQGLSFNNESGYVVNDHNK